MYQLCGVQHVHYENKQGRAVRGTRLYALFDDERVDGRGTDVFFVSADRVIIPDNLVVGSLFDVFYDKYGRVSAIHVC